MFFFSPFDALKLDKKTYLKRSLNVEESTLLMERLKKLHRKSYDSPAHVLVELLSQGDLEEEGPDGHIFDSSRTQNKRLSRSFLEKYHPSVVMYAF